MNPVAGGISTTTTPIPNNPSFVGIHAFAQAAPLTAGWNAAGIFTSNAVCLFIGRTEPTGSGRRGSSQRRPDADAMDPWRRPKQPR